MNGTEEPEPARKRALWVSLLAAFGLSDVELGGSPHARLEVQQVARQLWEAGATPAEVHRRCGLMRSQWSVQVTPTQLARHWHEYAQPQRIPVKAGLFFHPDNCPSPCSGCAADRKGQVDV